MTSIVAQRKAAIEAQLRAAASPSVSTPSASASVADSTEPSPYKKYNIKRVRKVSETKKRSWGLTKTTYVVKHEQPNSSSPPLSSTAESVARDAPTQQESQNGAQRSFSYTKPAVRSGEALSQASETQAPVDSGYYSEIPETISLQQSDEEDLDYSQAYPAQLSDRIDLGPTDAYQPADEQQQSVVTESVRSQSIQRIGTRAIPVPPSLPAKRKPEVREKADTNPNQHKEYEGSWQAKKMTPPQSLPGMPTPAMAEAAAQKYNKNKKRIQKAVRELEGEEEPRAKRGGAGCCVIL